MSRTRASWGDFAPVTLVSLLFLAQILVGISLLPRVSQVEILAYVGVGLYVCSGLIFGGLPVIEFRRRGGVRKGSSYVHTTRLVDTGIYSIVRHPQYVTFMLWAAAGMLLFQHWMVVLLGIPVFPLTYVDLIRADRDAVAKFGDDYKRYMERVPRMNFFAGLFRLLHQKRTQPEAND
jgi:protein-S-isoprenylcysteine O-methyltransferase Ste14